MLPSLPACIDDVDWVCCSDEAALSGCIFPEDSILLSLLSMLADTETAHFISIYYFTVGWRR